MGTAVPFKGFCQVKKNQKNPTKTRKWVGGTSPNSEFFNFVFFELFSCFQMFPFFEI